MKLMMVDAKWFSELSGEDFDVVYQVSDADVDGDHEFCGEYVTLAHATIGMWMFAAQDRVWWFGSREEVVEFAGKFGYEIA